MANIKNVILKKKVGSQIYDLLAKTSAQQVTYGENSTVYAELASALAAIAVLNGSDEGSVKKQIEDAIASLASNDSVVSAIVSSSTNGAITVTKGGTTSDVHVNGVVTVPTYDSATRTLTLPYRKPDGTTDSVVMALGKDSVVTTGTYNDGTKALDLTLSTGEVVSVPVASLIDIYVGEETASAKTTVSADNKISVEIKVSAADGNALQVNEEAGKQGLFVKDLSSDIAALDTAKVDKVEGKGLSTNDFTDELKQKLLDAGTSSFNGTYGDLINKPTINGVEVNGTLTSATLGLASADELDALEAVVATKVDKVDGKQLSTEDFTTAEKTKLAGLNNYDDSAITTTMNTKARIILSATEPADLTEADLWCEEI